MIKTKIDCDWSDSIGLLGYKDCCKNIMATPPLQWFFLAVLVLIFGLPFRTCQIGNQSLEHILRFTLLCQAVAAEGLAPQWRHPTAEQIN